MGYKDLLVYADTTETAKARLELALRLAADHRAHLAALYVMHRPSVPGYIAAELPAEVFASHEKMLREDAAQAEKLARDLAARAGLDLEWRTTRGDVVEIAQLHARHVDLTIVSQAGEGAAATLAADLPEALVMGSGRPVLVVPRFGTFATVGERVLVAWNATRESTRAVNDALPLLRRAKRAFVLVVNPQESAEARLQGTDMALHLARHGVAVEATTTRTAELGIGDVLLSRAADFGADLIVMGAYGHSRLREIVLGGATRHLLQHMTVPVLMAH
ncbi:MAG: universal stress protein [Pseudomonadota bacterium]